MKNLFLSVFFSVNIICLSKSAADHPAVAFGNEASGPIGTIAATSMPRGGWAIGLRTEFINSDQFSDAKLAGFAEQGVDDVHSIDSLVNSSVAVAYGASEDLSLSIRIPWIVRNNIREGEFDEHHGEGEVHGHGDAAGLGDLLVLANYRIFATASLDGSLQVGFKAPSGDDDESDQGQRLEMEFQPGSGSWDVLLGGALSKSVGRWGFHTNILYNITTEGSQRTEIGDAFFYNAAAVYALSGSDAHHKHRDGTIHEHLNWDVMLELNGEKRWANEISHLREINSGGDIVYISPGVRLSYKKLGAFVSVGLPVINDGNGVQTDVGYRLVGGVGFAF